MVFFGQGGVVEKMSEVKLLNFVDLVLTVIQVIPMEHHVALNGMEN